MSECLVLDDRVTSEGARRPIVLRGGYKGANQTPEVGV